MKCKRVKAVKFQRRLTHSLFSACNSEGCQQKSFDCSLISFYYYVFSVSSFKLTVARIYFYHQSREPGLRGVFYINY